MAIGDTGTFTDPHDGQVYPWKIMSDGKKWMTKNYNYKSPNSVCYENKESNGNKYGRMYDGNEAKGFVPDGWHIPTQTEYDGLFSKYEAKGITIDGNSGLDLMFGGICYTSSGNIRFGEINEFGSYWTQYNNGDQMGGKPAAWDFKTYKYYTRSGDEYEVQGAFILLTEHRCYVRYAQDI